MDKRKENIIVELTFQFSLGIIKFSDELEKNKKYVIARQLLKSGTSIGANVREAQNAESKPDFIHKMKIALKEADETEYWLMLINASEGYPKENTLLNDLHIIDKILTKIIGTSKVKSLPNNQIDKLTNINI
jgi:four helix bundle protein